MSLAETSHDTAVITPQAPIHVAHDATLWDEVKRTAALTWTVGLTDWKLRFYGSVLGVLWTLIRPFALFGIIYLVFLKLAKLDTKDVPHYPVYILMSMVLYQYFAEITMASVTCLVDREGLLRKIHFNPLVIPLAVATAATLNVGFTIGAVLIFSALNGVVPTWTWIELPFIVAFIAILAIGVGMLLSALYVRYRDMRPIWEVVSQALFYVSPILYVATRVKHGLVTVYLCNPLSAAFTQMRHAVIDPHAQTVNQAMGAFWKLSIPVGIVAVVFALGWLVFSRESPRVAENL